MENSMECLNFDINVDSLIAGGQDDETFISTCNNCKNHVETRYHCLSCDDFDLCLPCKNKIGHPHSMERLGFDLVDDSSPTDDHAQINPHEARKFSILRCIQALVHACRCRDANCRLPSCQKMKRVVAHTKNCKRKTQGGCPICKQLIALCCYHAKHCQEAKCLVPFCPNIKQKLKKQQIQQRFQQEQLLRRHMAAMNTRTAVPSIKSTPNPVESQSGDLSPSASQSSQSSSHNMERPQQNVIHVLNEVQVEAVHQQGVQIDSENVTLVQQPTDEQHIIQEPAINVPQSQEHQHQQESLSNNINMNVQSHGENISSMNSSQDDSNSNNGNSSRILHSWQPYPSVTSTQQVMTAGMPGSSQMTMSGMCPTESNSGMAQTQLHQREAIKELMDTLEHSSGPEQQRQILQILKANPQLMAAFIKQRQLQNQNQQQQQQIPAKPPSIRHTISFNPIRIIENLPSQQSGLQQLQANNNQQEQAQSVSVGNQNSQYQGVELNQESNSTTSTTTSHLRSNNEDWKISINNELRNHFVFRIVNTIFPIPDESAMKDERMSNLVSHAQKMEEEIYEKSSSRSEYFHLLAEKIYKIEKELEEKRQLIKEKEKHQLSMDVDCINLE